MFALVASSLLASFCAMSSSSPQSHHAAPWTKGTDSSYQALFNSGLSMAQFLEKAENRAKQWHDNYQTAIVPDALLARARASGGPWKLLVVAVDGCSDSVNTIPYLAKLVELVGGIELRIVNSTAGRWVMDSHRTADGRSATPTVVLLDAEFEEIGCFIDRPQELKAFMKPSAK